MYVQAPVKFGIRQFFRLSESVEFEMFGGINFGGRLDLSGFCGVYLECLILFVCFAISI